MTNTPKTEVLEGVRELLPCPFCGDPARHLPHKTGYWAERVICDACEFCVERSTDASAVERWNRRAATPAAPRSAAPGWMPIETAPKEVELLGWREDCGPMLIMHTSFDRFATEKECDETDEETLFQKDWFGAGIPGGMERLEGSEVPTLWKPIDTPPVTPSEGGKQ